MAHFARLIMFDRRGTGLSDPVSEPPTLEQEADDLTAVLNAAASEQVSIIGGSDLGLSALFPRPRRRSRLRGVVGRLQRSAVSPGMARKLMDMTAQTNLRAILPTISVPTLVLHCTGDRVVPVECGREVARLIPGARFLEYEGEDAYMWCGPGEVLASSTVKELVVGSGLRFADRGAQALRGVEGQWRLFALDREPVSARPYALER